MKQPMHDIFTIHFKFSFFHWTFLWCFLIRHTTWPESLDDLSLVGRLFSYSFLIDHVCYVSNQNSSFKNCLEGNPEKWDDNQTVRRKIMSFIWKISFTCKSLHYKTELEESKCWYRKPKITQSKINKQKWSS